ncbi:MAG: SCP2 sterol-binding domain-containing protein [Smithella sp.]|nr:SCP2 sterol-binding domain-containing protein [Smithella sp.]
MWKSLIPKAPENISVDDFFTHFVPNRFGRMKELSGFMNFPFLNGNALKMQFDIEGNVYSVAFKNGKGLEVARGSIDQPHLTLMVSEKDWRDAVTGKFNETTDELTGNPISFINAGHYEALMTMNGKVTMNLKKKDGANFLLNLIFNGEESPAVILNLDMVDVMHLINKKTTGLGLIMNGRFSFTGSVVLLLKLQKLM